MSPLTEPSSDGVSAAEVSKSPGTGGKENNDDDAGWNGFRSCGHPTDPTSTCTINRQSDRIKARITAAKTVGDDEDDVEKGTGGTKRPLKDRKDGAHAVQRLSCRRRWHRQHGKAILFVCIGIVLTGVC